MGEPLVSVVVVTLDNVPLLRDCLASLTAQSHEAVEIILVDNGSTDDVQKFVETEFPGVVFIRLPRNAGFAGGNNVGVSAAKGDFVALINNDAVADKDWIRLMVRAAEADEGVGQVASIIIDGDKPGILDSLGLGVALDGMTRQALKGEASPKLSEPRDVLMASGCACMFRSSALREAGLFDPDFFLYCEDADLGLRLRLLGYKAVVAPGAVVTHRHSMTLGKYSLKKVYFVERNHYWVAVKNFPFFLLPLVPVVTAWRFVLQAYHLLAGDDVAGFLSGAGFWELARTYFSAYADVARGLPSMLRKRRRIMFGKRIGGLEMARILFRYRLPMGKILGS
jgi:GT2 family glycosyltransferase